MKGAVARVQVLGAVAKVQVFRAVAKVQVLRAVVSQKNGECAARHPGRKRNQIEGMFGDEVVSQKPLPEGGVAASREIMLCLTESMAAVGADASSHNQKVSRVWLHNKAAKTLSLPVASFLGQGGQGSFVSLVNSPVEDAKRPFTWMYTRLTGYKRDNAELANGFMIFNKNGVPLEGKPKLVCLADIEKEMGNNVTMYGHAITRGGARVTITPSPSAVAWVPAAPAVGDEFHSTPATLASISAPMRKLRRVRPNASD